MKNASRERETRLSECLDALTSGRWDIDECLRRHPEHAAELRPHLLAAMALSQSYAVAPREEFAADARERFLVASGQRLQEAFDTEPSLTFFASARVKFLMAAQRMKLGERAPQRRGFPVFGTPFRALASAGAAVVMMLGASTYTVAEASDSIPGDSLYGVKLQTERVRLALAFSEDAKRNIRIDIVAERSNEIEQMTARGRIIGPGVIDRLSDQTAPLVAAAENNELDDGDLQRLRAVTEKQQEVLAEAAPQVAPEAQPQLQAAIAQAEQGSVIAAVARVNKPAPAVITPDIPLSSLVTETATPEPTETSDASATAEGGTPAASPTVSPTPARTNLVVDPEPVDVANGVSWVRLAVDRFTTLIPSEADGWRIAGLDVNDGPVAAPRLIRLANTENTSLITINPRNGDMYWFIAINGVFDEIIMRETRGGQVFVADRAVLQRLYGNAVDVPLFVLDNIVITPEPTPTPAPRTATPTASAQ